MLAGLAILQRHIVACIFAFPGIFENDLFRQEVGEIACGRIDRDFRKFRVLLRAKEALEVTAKIALQHCALPIGNRYTCARVPELPGTQRRFNGFERELRRSPIRLKVPMQPARHIAVARLCGFKGSVVGAFASVNFMDFLPAVIKSFFFGAVIGLVGTYKGYNAGRGTESVGVAANSAVVLASLLVIIVDMIAVQFTDMLLS